MNLRPWLTGIALIFVAVSAPAHGGAIRSPVAVVGNTIGTGGGTTGHLLDQSGLSVPFVSGLTDFQTYIAAAPTHAVGSPINAWASSAHSTGYLEFDLGTAFSLLTFAVWTQNNLSALDSFSLSSAFDAGFTSGVSNLGAFNAAMGLGVQTFPVSAIGEFVRLQINSSHGAANVNIGEIAFDTIALPEPATLALLGIGLPGLGFVRRRRVWPIQSDAIKHSTRGK